MYTCDECKKECLDEPELVSCILDSGTPAHSFCSLKCYNAFTERVIKKDIWQKSTIWEKIKTVLKGKKRSKLGTDFRGEG